MTTPRWLEALNHALNQPENKTTLPVYQIATTDPKTGAPRVRSQMHQQFLTPTGHPNLPVLVTSTDVRALKVEHILGNPIVDVAWWLEGSADQFRLTGRAFIVPAPEHAPMHAKCFAQLKDCVALETINREGIEGFKSHGGLDTFDWEKKRQERFKEMRPQLKATWRIRERPGSVIPSYEELLRKYPTTVPNLEEAKTEEEKRYWHESLANFAMMLIEPSQVEWLQLSVDPNKRILFTRTDDAAHEWKEEILVP